MILCDTNIWIELYKGNAKIIGTLRQIGRTSIGISVTTKAELLFGAMPMLPSIKRRVVFVHRTDANLFP